MEKFSRLGVTSFDSTSAFRQAFMDDRKNYHTLDDTFVAIRVPQVEGNLALKKGILAGQISQRDAVVVERECLRSLRAYDAQDGDIASALSALAEYEIITRSKTNYSDAYKRTLTAKPWKECPCMICQKHGIEVAIFRGTERNKRRGFHNLSVLADKMHAIHQSIKI